MIESSKYNRKNYPRKCFSTQEKETQVKFNPGLSANRPLNNWALVNPITLITVNPGLVLSTNPRYVTMATLCSNYS